MKAVLNIFVLLSAMGGMSCANILTTADGTSPSKKAAKCNLPSAATTALGGGVYETVSDATCETAWTYFDFDTRTVVAVSDPFANAVWDVGFQRFKIRINGGVSGNAGATLVALNGDNFSSRTQAPYPFTPALTDQADANGDANDACRPPGVKYAFLDSTASGNGCWFAYNTLGTHTLDPRNIAYVLKTNQPKYYKVKILTYYGPTGTSGMIKFQWAEVLAP